MITEAFDLLPFIDSRAKENSWIMQKLKKLAMQESELVRFLHIIHVNFRPDHTVSQRSFRITEAALLLLAKRQIFLTSLAISPGGMERPVQQGGIHVEA
jgi:hypothetical protein